ncbi:uncharacterized protein LOC129949079 [Eupeodes corollae]|uniref:uncharacterized protein LOC129949079 n=1 Tax=Eupeodes corollae TaxID=290404 RepID=UPI002490DA24|nr:uncharacterized protein LOC129949079 [Eupeodes corollae]
MDVDVDSTAKHAILCLQNCVQKTTPIRIHCCKYRLQRTTTPKGAPKSPQCQRTKAQGKSTQKLRFICRRGLPKTIYCDNGTNFVGAQTILREIQEEIERGAKAVRRYAAEEGFNFALIPPRAPHFGGLWEAAVKAAKTLLQRTVGNALLTTEELLTVVIEVEGILNSRPIAPLSADPNDGEALTPAHLLIGSSLRSLPPEPVPERQTGCLKRWQLLCWLKQQFWLKWSKEYLLGLQARSKWVQEQPNLVVGKLVLIHEDNSPPQRWKTGRVIGVVEGQDGKVRVADVKTSSGVLRRPIVKLAPLPDEEY